MSSHDTTEADRALIEELKSEVGQGGFTDWPVEEIDLWEYKPADYNPRKISPEGLKRLLRSLRENGQLDTITVNRRTKRIVSGHQRAKALLAADIATVWARVVDMDENRERAANIAANNRQAQGEFDDAMLADLLTELNEIDDPEFDLEALTAFDMDEIDALIEDSGEGLGGGGEDTEPPEPPENPVSRLGDLWCLGDHRVLCGDATKADDVERVMGGERAGVLFTSPPYLQQRDYTDASDVSDWDALMQGVFGSAIMADDGQILVNLGLIHRNGEWIPYWDGWIEWMRTQGWRRFGWYVWDQGEGLPGHWQGRFAPCFEFVFHFNKNSAQPDKTVPCKSAGQQQQSALISSGAPSYSENKAAGKGWTTAATKIPNAIIRAERDKVGQQRGHPAVFPVGLPSVAVSSWPGDVFDPFLGSGTTAIACENLGRKCRGIEIEPRYVDVVIRRWQEHSESEATLDGDGRTFAEVAQDRA